MNQQQFEEIKQKALQFLKLENIGVISTISSQNTPESALVFFLLEENWNLYVLTHTTSRKTTNLLANPHVAFVVGTSIVPHTVQLEGTAQLLDKESEEFKNTLIKFQQSKKLGLNPLFAPYKDHYAMIKIQPTWIRYLEFNVANNAEEYTVLFPEGALS